MRRGKNAIIKAGRRDGMKRVRAPIRGTGRRSGKRRGKTGACRMPSPLSAGGPVF